MKSERRHELQHNELADWLIKAGQRIKPYQNALLAGAVALVVIVGGYSMWTRSAAKKSAGAWTELSAGLQSGNLDTLTKVVADYPNTNVAYVAALVTADAHLAQGCNERFNNKVLALKELRSAVTSYSTVLDQCRTPSLVERATYGLARAKETLGDLDVARKLYGETAAMKGTYAAAASELLDDLNRRDTKEMFDKFSHYDPTPVSSDTRGDLGPAPNLTFPEESPSATPEKKPAIKIDEKKPAAKPDEKKPAAKPAEKTPAAKPDEKKPDTPAGTKK